MRAARHLALPLLLALALSLSACGAGAGSLGRDISHASHSASHALSRVSPYSSSHKGHKAISAAFCLYHGYRTVQDIRHSHPGWSALQAYGAYRSCKRLVPAHIHH